MFIIAGQIIWIITRLTRYSGHHEGEEIVARYRFRFNDGQISIFVAIFVLHILQQRLLVLGSSGSLFRSVDIDSPVPLSK